MVEFLKASQGYGVAINKQLYSVISDEKSDNLGVVKVTEFDFAEERKR